MNGKNVFLALALSLAGLNAPAALANDGTVTKLELSPAKERAIFILSYEGEGAQFRTFQSTKQGSVVVEADGLALPPNLTRVIDGAKSNGPVVQLTPYSSANGKRSLAKFVLQLRGAADLTSSELPGKFMLEVRSKKDTAGAKLPAGVKQAAAAPRGPVRPSWSETDAVSNKDGASEKSEAVARRLVETLNAPPEAKNYSGSPVSFEASNADVHDVFRLVGEASGLNIVTDSEVKGASNYTLRDIPWDQLLDIVVQQNQLKAKVSGNVVRIVTLEKFTKEQEDKMKELSLADEMEPVVMAVIPLSYADAAKMKTTLETLLINRQIASGGFAAPGMPNAVMRPTGSAAGDRSIQQDFIRGKIEVDARSNSLVITNTRDSIDRIRRLVKELDVALPQVLIDTKVVIATDSFSRNVGVNWGGTATSTGSGRAGFGAALGQATSSDSASTTLTAGGTAAAGGVAGSTGATTTGSTGSASGSTSSQFVLAPVANQFLTGFKIGAGQHGNLSATLALAEINNVSKTVASPRVIVNNNQEATITDGETITVQTTPGVQSSGTLQSVNAALSLRVKPQVTSSGAVLLDVDIKKSAITGGLNTSDKTIKTNVLVESGSTLVLGGVYQFTSTKKETGVPLLKDLPFIGQIFRSNEDNDNKQELMVFLTPQILDTNSSTFGAGVDAPTGSM